jgi:hypothetical protein
MQHISFMTVQTAHEERLIESCIICYDLNAIASMLERIGLQHEYLNIHLNDTGEVAVSGEQSCYFNRTTES